MDFAFLPKYKCHKVVGALKIEKVTSDLEIAAKAGREATTAGAVLSFRDFTYEDLHVDAEFVAKHRPQAGGYYVVYKDGYASWSPAEAFEEGYAPVDDGIGVSFSDALIALKDGKRLQRAGWNGKGLWIELQRPDEHSKMTLPYLFICYPDDAENTPGARVPWLASQTDILANDWRVVE